MDFVTGLPASHGNTVILTVVDRFSKTAHLIPLPKLPTARETAEIMLKHVFRLHGLPCDVVSDRGPQFTSRFWSEFCTLLGAKVSLSSGFHPQTNGQAERMNQEMETALRCLASRNPSSWSKHLLWWSMPTTPFPVRPLASLPSSAPRGSSHPSFPSKNVRPGFLQSRRLFGGADTPGGRLVRFFSAPPTATDGPPTDVALRPPGILQDNMSGCPLVISRSVWSPGSWRQGLWARFPSPE